MSSLDVCSFSGWCKRMWLIQYDCLQREDEDSVKDHTLVFFLSFEARYLQFPEACTWNLLENMTNRFPHIPDFAWIYHALPLNLSRQCVSMQCTSTSLVTMVFEYLALPQVYFLLVETVCFSYTLTMFILFKDRICQNASVVDTFYLHLYLINLIQS